MCHHYCVILFYLLINPIKMLRNKLYSFGDETLKVPYHLHFGKEMLDRMMEYGDYPALINVDTTETLTYRQLAQQTVDIALSLSRLGVGKGDVVSVCSEKRIEVMATIFGTFCVGATFSATDHSYGIGPLIHRLEISKPKVMFCSPTAYDQNKSTFDSAGRIEHYIIYGDEIKDGGVLFKDFLTETADVGDFVPTPVDGWKDLLMILYSSGTTGLPKGIPWTHLGFLVNSVSMGHERFKYTPILVTREWCYSYGLGYTLGSLRGGTTVVFSARSDVKEFLQAIQDYKIKTLLLTPATITELIKSTILDQYDVSSIEVIVSASTPVMAEQVVAVKKRFPKLEGVYQLYGASEIGSICNEIYAPFGPRDGSVGPPSHGCIIKVVDIETRHPLGPNQRGEICFKSPSLTPGYIGTDSRNHLDEEGFFKSGDIGHYDNDRYFYVIDRMKELIKCNDYAIAPAELESILLRHPCVREAGVVGAPHADCGEAPTAFVVLQPGGGVRAEELTEYLNSQVTFRMKLVGGVRFVEKLPRGAGEKLDRKALKLML